MKQVEQRVEQKSDFQEAAERAARALCFEAKVIDGKAYTLAEIRKLGAEADEEWPAYYDRAVIALEAASPELVHHG